MHPSPATRARRIAASLLVLGTLCAGFAASLAAQQPAPPVGSAPDAAQLAPEPAGGRGAWDDALHTGMKMLTALGVWTIPFAVVTFIVVWFTVERLVVLRRGRVIPRPFVERFLKLLDAGELDPDEALSVCLENDSPIAHIFAHGVRKWGKPSVEVEQAIIDGGERQVGALRTHLRVLNGASTISPLLGLLGTVWGMLMAFDEISLAGAQGSTDRLAQNIALALVTTVAGLVIAIPSLAIYMFLSGRVDALVMEMDELSQQVVHCISGEALEERASRPRRAPRAAEKQEAEPAAKKKAV